MLSNAIAAICPDIQDRLAQPCEQPVERKLWWELSSCILSSQVPYALAVAAADAIDAEGLLFAGHCSREELTTCLARVLRKPLLVGGRCRMYRFPVSRARQLAATHEEILTKAPSLSALVNRFADAAEARAWFVDHAPGIGPKQASMFLRNVGASYDLAILDRHVLSYMTVARVYTGQNYSISSLNRYRRLEDALRKHADSLNCPVGILDWAIWIVMRVASRKSERIST
jgi:N-glycosylase/DNA lyase